MGSDVLLAIGHHIAAFTVLATLAAEWGIVRPGLTRQDAMRIRTIDAIYGIAAASVLVIGLIRVFFGPAHASFYLSNPFFWAKMSAFGVIGLLSIGGTTRYQRWATAVATDAAWEVPPAEVTSTRRALIAQLALFPLIPVCAALMARGIGT